MNIIIHNGYLTLDHLSKIELYFASSQQILSDKLVIAGEEYRHAVKVMRHGPGEILYATDGIGNFYSCKIKTVTKSTIETEIIERKKYENKFDNIYFVIPKLKSPDRFEFAIEKCVELGVTNFIIFNAERSISKAEKTGRWEKISAAAMKQSLRFYLPVLKTIDSLKEIADINGVKFVFEQHTENKFRDIIINKDKEQYFIFGPEGGLTENELNLFSSNDLYNLLSHRLRTETAIVKCAGLLSELM